MFAKNILSILGLFLTASHLANAAITSITITDGVCTVNDDGNENVGKLYIVSGNEERSLAKGHSNGDVKKIVSVNEKQEGGFECGFENLDGVDLCVDDNDIVRERIEGVCNGTYESGDCTYITCNKNNVCRVTIRNANPSALCDVTSAVETCDKGYYLVESNLYKCDGVKVNSMGCEIITGNKIPIGYLVNKYEAGKPYIECSLSENSTDRECTAKTTEALSTTCSGAGVLFVENGKKRLCVDGTISVDLSTDTNNDGIDGAGNYMIPLGNTGLFGIDGSTENYYLVVKVDDEGNATLVGGSDTHVRYRYTAADINTKSTLYQVYERSSSEICGEEGAAPFEFMMVQWIVAGLKTDIVDYYIEGDNKHLNTEPTNQSNNDQGQQQGEQQQ